MKELIAAGATASDELDETRGFVVRLSRALHTYGTPVHRLESAIEEVGGALGLELSVFATPTAIFTSFRGELGDETRFVRQQSGEVDLGKLSELDDVAQDVIAGEIDAVQGSRRVDEIVNRSSGATWWRWLAYGAASAGFATFFGGAWDAVAGSFVLGVMLGVLESLLVPGRWQQLFELLGAISVAFLAACLSSAFGVSAAVLTVAGVIVLVPGLSLTQSVTELAQGSLVSGSSRLLGTMLSFLMLGFGSELGRRLSHAWVTVPGETPGEPWILPIQLLAAACSALAFSVIFRASRRDVPAIVALTVVTYLAIVLVRPLFGPVFTALVAAFIVGSVSNGYARWQRRPSLVLRVPAMLILVPGSFGLRSVLLLVDADVFRGVETAFTMLFLAVALAAGLLTANAVIRPRQRL